MKLSYKKAGVDIDRGNEFVSIIKPLVRNTFDKNVLGDIGSFGAFYKLNRSGLTNPVLVSSTDGVGTKLKIAFILNRHNTVGIDLVAMCVNDILTSGARPLFFLDYFASGKLSLKQSTDVVKGIIDGCKLAGCSLIGGETAEMPGFYAKGEYDLSGFAVGVVDKNKIITGSSIKAGDELIGLASSGMHSNGYSLVRKLFFDIKGFSPGQKVQGLDCSIGSELLKPTKIYVKPVLKLLSRYRIKGIAHITGGGLTENLPRLLGSGRKLNFEINRGSWPVHEIFNLIQSLGKIPEEEMFKTFNMGIGMVLVADGKEVNRIITALKRSGEQPYVIGRVKRGTRKVAYK